jgi:exodeoxyribonuclease V alpha subunit
MAARNHEITAVWMGRKFDFGDDDARVEIGDIRLVDGTFVTAKIRCREDELILNGTYRLFGRYQKHPQYGNQWITSSWVEEKPVDEDSIIAYLCQCKSPARGSITYRVAVKLFEQFGFQAIDTVIDTPAVAAADISRWDADKAAIASRVLQEDDHKRGAKMELISLFEGRGFPKQSDERAIKAFGTNAAGKVRRDPYIMMQLPGIGFKAADKLFCELAKQEAGTDGNRYKDLLAVVRRQGLCACYEVQQDRSGSTWVLAGVAKAAVHANVSGTRAKPDEAIQWAIEHGRLVTYTQGGQEWVANASRALHEQEISCFVEQPETETEWPSITDVMKFCPDGKPLSTHQQNELEIALSERVGCLQGSPGVGKTFAVACLVKAVIHSYGKDSIAVACPTGKAAVRASQALHENGVEFEASTVHRLLGVKSAAGGGWQFNYNELKPLPYRFLVLDEESMKDVDLMAAMFRACTADMCILLVGDINQLSPVGHGRPFQDLQQLIPTGHLTEIRRNSGRIVQACAEIRDHQKFVPSKSLNIDAGENMPLIELDSPEQQLTAVENLIRRIGAEDFNCDTMWDIQVLTATNDKTPISRKPLNQLLQQQLNPDGVRVKGNPFRVGDKVVCLKNGTFVDSEDKHEEHFVANGELAEVMELRPGRMELRLFDPMRRIAVPHAVMHDAASGEEDDSASRGALSNWDLGYALSVHRSQGSQWKYVFVMVDSAGPAQAVQTRNWLYTGISRAVDATFILGRRQDCVTMMRKDGTSGRKTLLVERTQRSRVVRTVDFEALFASV